MEPIELFMHHTVFTIWSMTQRKQREEERKKRQFSTFWHNMQLSQNDLYFE